MNKARKLLITIFLLTLSIILAKAPEEGQYPLSEIKKLDLQKAGLLISQDDIYNPDGISLIDALVNVNGCTGSFVSAEGLIITNHHCAFAGVNAASTPEHNYLEDGFLAESREKEISAKDYKVKITESYEDVSDVILEAISGVDNLEERSKIITKKMKELGEAATNKGNSIEGKVSEMFAGQSYILFIYRIIEDVRIVYVPPRTIGEFGGESDNWVWPRHTGDFTFMRAYVAPDGSSAEYSKENIPFVPKKYLEVNPKGVEEGDFAFVLGYPGRTYRNQPSQFIEEQYNYQLPYISNLYSWTIDLIEAKTEGNEEMSLAYSTHIKRLSNTMKNYKGKIQGLRNTELIKTKQAEEKEMLEFINNNDKMKQNYGTLLGELNDVYSKRMELAEANLWFGALYRLSDDFKLARFVIQNAEEKEKENSERKQTFKDENIEKSILKFDETFKISMESIEKELLVKMICDARMFSDNSRVIAVDNLITKEMKKQDVAKFVEDNFISMKITNKENFENLLTKSLDELKELDNTLIKFALELNEQNKLLNSENDKIDGALSKLLPQFNEVKKEWKNILFIPDANGTLRFTYGYIKGYSPKDAIYSSPITTLKGIIEKSYLGSEYAIPTKLKELYDAKDFGQFYNPKLKSIPVGLLYNMDTTGGNSGSPILDAQGKLIGVNFDRAYEATINDFAWNDDYSRSIGVDIRYILWVTQKLGGADFLLEEMGVKVD
ncbi:MAG: S46 family peptidase [Bacteroidetes bacterium]|nr:S46 family peptidase [Bacteroidota bacterium]MBU1114796.1 S46 family peptidase [Bacteroidota bacterium]MBU1799841.1 S46 family peptidase [Bacteroidota bacterium]